MPKNNRNKNPFNSRIIESNFCLDGINQREFIPQLFWPIYEVDADISYSGKDKIVYREYSFFPGFDKFSQSIDSVLDWEQKKDTNMMRYDSFFINELFSSTTAYIVDKFFDVAEYDIIMRSLSESEGYQLRKLFIICDSNYKELRHRMASRNHDEMSVSVEIKVSSLSLAGLRYFDIHDRFALLDDEIWHFGWTICGMGHTLNAYSRGWADRDGRFREYLDKIVKKS